MFMNKPLLFLLSFLITFSVFSQKTKIEDLLKIKTEYIKHLITDGHQRNTVKLKMDFNSPEILNPEAVAFLKDVNIVKIDLYYTAFQMSETFSQPKLNKTRLENLKKILPSAFEQPYIQWHFIGQNGCKTEQIAKTYFHGFIITYIPKVTEKETEREITDINKIFKSDSLGYDSVYTIYTTSLKRKKYKTGYYLPVSKSKKEKGIVYKSKGLFNRPMQYAIRIDTIKRGTTYHTFVKNKHAMSFVKRNMTDTTIFAVLNRHQNWHDIAFVCDVTGSMSAYTSQLLVWYKLNSIGNKIQCFTFFNDGDDKPDRKKKIGKTGGIYQMNAGNYTAVSSVVEKAMRSGSGGDAPENNCEDLISAIQEYPNAKEFVMIADNFANIKDLELIKQVNKPIHIIICGTGNFMINTDYLDLARSTNGSIHSIEQDIENMMNINEGSVIEFDHKKFVLRNGKFQPLVDL